MQQSAATMFQQPAGHITGRLSELDVDSFDKAEQRMLKALKRSVADVRLDLRDYEYADTAAEVAKHAKNARERLAALRALVLTAGEAGVFGAADVAQFTGQFDAVADTLQ